MYVCIFIINTIDDFTFPATINVAVNCMNLVKRMCKDKYGCDFLTSAGIFSTQNGLLLDILKR